MRKKNINTLFYNNQQGCLLLPELLHCDEDVSLRPDDHHRGDQEPVGLEHQWVGAEHEVLLLEPRLPLKKHCTKIVHHNE